MGEFDLIKRFFKRGAVPGVPQARGGAGENSKGVPGGVILGIGDDCALLRAPAPGQALAISTDMLIEGRHFFAGTVPAAIGHKSLAVNLSDLAAMGAEPLGFTLAIALPAVDEDWLGAFCGGMFRLADRYDCPLVGGDTTRGPLAISITVFGQVPAADALRRDRARSGDEIWVSGPLGGASLAVTMRRQASAAESSSNAPQGAEGAEGAEGAARRLDWPQPRIELGRGLRGLANAAIDLSDGLAGDLRHVLTASSGAGELGAELSAADLPIDPCLAHLPRDEALRHVLTGGDDYELLFTAPPRHHQTIRTLCPGAAMIGLVRSGRGILLTGGDGTSAPLEGTGFDHFRE